MGKLLVLVVLVVAAVWLIRRAFRAHTRSTESTEVPKATEDLVRCAHCGVLLPRAEARLTGGALYCTEAHARLGPGGR